MKEGRRGTRVERVGGYLHRVVPILDSAGKVLDYASKPLMVESRARDLMQVIVAVAILAVPVAFTEEDVAIGRDAPAAECPHAERRLRALHRLFAYFNVHRFAFKGHAFEYVKRSLAIYVLSLIVVGALLTMIERAPWTTEPLVAVSGTLIVAFPASMSAAVSDALK